MDVDVDVDGWESEHWAAYGCGAWERACHQAGILVAWYEEQVLGFGAPAALRGLPGPRVKWPWASGRHTVGLLLWRAAYEAGILVDQVPLADTMRYCDPETDSLVAGPLPDAARNGGIGIGSAESVARIRHVLQAHVAADLPQPPPAGVQPTLGYRVRELRATPDWGRGDWPTAIALAREAMQRADDLREQGTWQPTAQERSAGARIGLDWEAVDEPAASGGLVRSWLVRASRMVDLAATLSTAADTLPCDGRGNPGPLAQALGTTARACAALRTSAEEVERMWAAEPHEPEDPTSWELSYVPAALRTQTEETGHLVRAAAVFLWVLAYS
ncbi:hypothetical protein ACIA8E_32495 [Streptomyces sp. NPDC051664]|uniref:hypothetical protein n=1 Tax=Streptomyces sp. NPDC051664 TaxID=3365668 RepID=UPI0037B193EC